MDVYGRWTEEKDYNNYPKEKWCDYDIMAVWIRKSGYEIKTTIENLITMIFAHYEGYREEANEEFTFSGCQEYVMESGGLSEFDYEL